MANIPSSQTPSPSTPDVPTQIAPPNPADSGPRRPLRRAVITFMVILIVLLAASVAGLALLRNSRSQPYNVSAYPGATIVVQDGSANRDRKVYITGDDFGRVANYYAGQLGQGTDQGCKKIYLDSTLSDSPGHVMMRCVVDQSVLDVQQTAYVTVSSKVDPNDATNLKTQIEIDRSWTTP